MLLSTGFIDRLDHTLESIELLATAGAEALVLHLPPAELMRAVEADRHTSMAWRAGRERTACASD